MVRILIIEDHGSIVEGLRPAFELQRFDLVHAADCKAGRKLASTGQFALVLLDINLPDGNGLDLCQEIREAFPNLPIIMLTAREDEKQAVRGFQQGATDYVRKPFGIQELVARIQRSLSQHVGAEGMVSFAGLSLQPGKWTAAYGSKILQLSRTEFRLLELLVKRAGGAVTRDEIVGLLDDTGEILDRTVDSHISHLRKKLKAATNSKLSLKALYGVGYRLEQT